MTLQFVGTAVADRIEPSTEVLLESPWEAPSTELRVTRGVGSGQALVAVAPSSSECPARSWRRISMTPSS